MRAGSLNTKITFLAEIETRGSLGNYTSQWIEYAQAWASIEPIKNDEKFISVGLFTFDLKKIRIRYIKDIVNDMRISYDNNTYQIEQIVDVWDRHRELIIFARSVA